jgi:organic radical activating enzyme
MRFCKFTKYGSGDMIYINPSIVSSVQPREKTDGSQITLEGGEPLFVPQDAEEVVEMLDEALAG